MASRNPSRLRVLALAALHTLRGGRKRPDTPRRILVAHHLLLGDTLMLTPLLAKLRQNFPAAEIVMTTPKAIAPLYAKRPYGVLALPYDPRDLGTLQALRKHAGFDLAIVPGDNRFSWLARALDARWIVAFDGDRPAYKSWPVDELRPYPDAPAAWGDMVAELAAGPEPRAYLSEEWPAPEAAPLDLPPSPYCVLHVGASSRLRLWAPENWRAFAAILTQRGYQVVWSSGRNEQALVAEIDPDGRYPSFAGQLDLPQMWRLLEGAHLLACPDTGIAHLGRLTGTPTVTLFGPGSAVIFGAGRFWRNSPYRAVTVDDIPCRDQDILFRRHLPWVRRCGRSTKECATARCMACLAVEDVLAAIEDWIPPIASR